MASGPGRRQPGLFERKARNGRVERFRAARQAQLAASEADPAVRAGGQVLRRTLQPPDQVLAAPARPWRFAGAVAVATGAVLAGVSTGLPVWDRPLRPAPLAACAAVAVAAAVSAGNARARTSRRAARAALAAALAVVALFGWGLRSSVVIDGKVYASTSETAKAYRLSQRILADLYRMSDLAALLDLPAADARARFDDYEPAQAELERMRDRYAAVGEAQLPSAQFAPVVDHMKAAAHYAAEAFDRKQKLLTESDVRLEQELGTIEAQMLADVTAAGAALTRAAGLYGFQLNGVRE